MADWKIDAPAEPTYSITGLYAAEVWGIYQAVRGRHNDGSHSHGAALDSAFHTLDALTDYLDSNPRN